MPSFSINHKKMAAKDVEALFEQYKQSPIRHCGHFKTSVNRSLTERLRDSQIFGLKYWLLLHIALKSPSSQSRQNLTWRSLKIGPKKPEICLQWRHPQWWGTTQAWDHRHSKVLHSTLPCTEECNRMQQEYIALHYSGLRSILMDS